MSKHVTRKKVNNNKTKTYTIWDEKTNKSSKSIGICKFCRLEGKEIYWKKMKVEFCKVWIINRWHWKVTSFSIRLCCCRISSSWLMSAKKGRVKKSEKVETVWNEISITWIVGRSLLTRLVVHNSTSFASILRINACQIQNNTPSLLLTISRSYAFCLPHVGKV